MAFGFRRNRVMPRSESADHHGGGWYADPYGAAARRWYDNVHGWTDRVQHAGQAPDKTGLARLDEAAVTATGSARPVDPDGKPTPLSRPADPLYMASAIRDRESRD